MRIRTSAQAVAAGAVIAIAAGCRDVTAPARQAPGAAHFAAQPSKGVWTVTTLDDPGAGSCTSSSCSLRDALAAAQSGDKIVFKSSVSGTIALAQLLAFGTDVTVDGGGRITLAQGFDADSRLIGVYAAAKVALVGLTITSSSSAGGGIWNLGDLTISNSTVSGGVGVTGGAIHNSGRLTLVSSTVSGGNAPTGSGGAIYNDVLDGVGNLTVISSTIAGNSATLGGGIANAGGTVTLVSTTISGNTAVAGAGIYESSGGGGGVSVTSSTITQNVDHPDFTHNGAGAVLIENSRAEIRNSILAGNWTATQLGPLPIDCAVNGGVLTSVGHNITVSCPALTAATDKTILFGEVSTELLDPTLRDNGGPTKTHALIERGLAVDAGYCPGETADQRGFVRPYDDTRLANALDGCDVGAFEWQPPALTKHSR